MGLRGEESGEERQGLSADWEEDADWEGGRIGRANVFNRAIKQREDVAESGRGYDYLFCEKDPIVNKSDLLSTLALHPPAFFHSHHNNH